MKIICIASGGREAVASTSPQMYWSITSMQAHRQCLQSQQLLNNAGWALLMDGDMPMLDDIAKFGTLRDECFVVMVIMREHVPQEERKFLDGPQTTCNM